MLDSIIDDSNKKLGLGDKAGSLLSSLLDIITDQRRGGFSGFLERFKQIGLSVAVNSWVGNKANIPLSNKQVEDALGAETVSRMSRQAGIDYELTKSALGQMIPGVVDTLTPHGTVPTDGDLLSVIGGYLSGIGGSTVSTTGVMAGESSDRIGTAAAENISRRNALNLIDEEFVDNSPLRWLAPLIILALLVITGWAFCGNSGAT